MSRRIAAFAVALALLGACSARSTSSDHDAAKAPTSAALSESGMVVLHDDEVPSGSPSYMGRPIAPPMSYEGADWLERPEREQEERPEHMLDILEIAPGSVVADVGAGSGFYAERLVRRVGPTGKVIATDLQPEMIAMVKKRVADKHLANVETILTTETDAKLPANAIDLVLMVDVYHELGEPHATLEQIKRALRKGGRIALVEFRAEDPNVPIKEVHKTTLDQMKKELAASGFVVTKVDESLPWQRVIVATIAPP